MTHLLSFVSEAHREELRACVDIMGLSSRLSCGSGVNGCAPFPRGPRLFPQRECMMVNMGTWAPQFITGQRMAPTRLDDLPPVASAVASVWRALLRHAVTLRLLALKL